MSSVSHSLRMMGALAMLLLVPAALYIEAALAAERISARLPKQKEALAKVQNDLRRRPISCARGADRRERLTPAEASLEPLFLATAQLGGFDESDGLIWAEKHGLPFAGASYALHKALIELYYTIQDFQFHFGFCEKHLGDEPADHEEDEASPENLAALREEEAASLKWLEGVLTALEKHDHTIAAAQGAFESDRTGLLVLAWVLGALQVIGWGLTVFVILPRDYRAWRAKRAASSKPDPSRPA